MQKTPVRLIVTALRVLKGSATLLQSFGANRPQQTIVREDA